MSSPTPLQLLIALPDAERAAFEKLVKKMRAKYMPTSAFLVAQAAKHHADFVNDVLTRHNISEAIFILREQAYHLFLLEEAQFNVAIVNYIGRHVHTPKDILDQIIEAKLPQQSSLPELRESVISICGEYAGRIMPYLYMICQSNTQSRRSRAGEVFEQIIYLLYTLYDYPFDSQKKIGRKIFQDKGLGKKVDSVLPSIEAFDQRRDKVIIGTMKTTLRERWQEVVEEIDRTKIPKIYLLTADSEIARNKANEIGKHNIVLVVYEKVKVQDALVDLKNIISFEQYFLAEVPSELKFWKK